MAMVFERTVPSSVLKEMSTFLAIRLSHRKFPVSSIRLRAAGCGLRRSEVLALRWSDVNLEDGTLTVQRSRTPRKRKDVTTESTVIADPKRPRSFRTIPLPAGVLAALLLRLALCGRIAEPKKIS
jgi:integrase